MENGLGMELPGGRRLLVAVGDLLQAPVDAIVNAANGHLEHGGGVAAAIARAAGPDLDRESRDHVATHGPVSTGEAAVTTAGDLPFDGVIHAVGPRLGDGDEERLLAQAVGSALLRAGERGWRSVAFPAISSGIFAVPLDVCARAYVAGTLRYFDEHPDSPLTEVRLYLAPGPLEALVAEEIERARSTVSPPDPPAGPDAAAP